MRVTSRGLGRKELVMDFREYDVARSGNEIVISGTISEPVNWDFSVRMSEDDLSGLIRVALKRPTLALILRGLLRPPRWRRSHWSTDRATHVAQIKERRQGRVDEVERLRSREAEKAAPKPAASPASKPVERPVAPAAERPAARPAASTVSKPVVGLAAQRARSAALRPVLGGARADDGVADAATEPEGQAVGDTEAAAGS